MFFTRKNIKSSTIFLVVLQIHKKGIFNWGREVRKGDFFMKKSQVCELSFCADTALACPRKIFVSRREIEDWY